MRAQRLFEHGPDRTVRSRGELFDPPEEVIVDRHGRSHDSIKASQ
jgi:hypothetical protein